MRILATFLLTFTVAAKASAVDFYVSATGDDTRDGKTPATSLRLPATGCKKLKTGDRLLLRRGDTWPNGIGPLYVGGITIGAYGEGPLPLLKPVGLGVWYTDSSKWLEDITIRDIAMDAYDQPRLTNGANNGYAGVGVHVMYLRRLTVTGCSFRGFASNIQVQTAEDVTISDCRLTDAYAIGRHSQGLYANGVKNLTLERDYFEHNGWRADVPGAQATIFNHNVYITAACGPATVRGCVFSRASSYGLQARSGGTIERNVFIDNPYAMEYGLTLGSPPKLNGVSGAVRGNMVLSSGTVVRYGFQFANTAGVVVESNYVRLPRVPGSVAYEINTGNGYGVKDLTLTGNVGQSGDGLRVTDDPRDNMIGGKALAQNVTVTGNVLDASNYTLWFAASHQPRDVGVSSNWYVNPTKLLIRTAVGNTTLDWPAWSAKYGDGSVEVKN